MVKKFKAQTKKKKKNPNLHTETEIYKFIPLRYERSS